MQDQSDSHTSPAAQSRPGPQTGATTQAGAAAKPRVRDELLGPPRPSWRAPFSAAMFGVLLVVSLVAPVVTDAQPMPGLSLVLLGMMSLLGFADLLDADHRRTLIALRVSGFAVALLGLAV